jgi:hypothetical protein
MKRTVLKALNTTFVVTVISSPSRAQRDADLMPWGISISLLLNIICERARMHIGETP